jgi:hypothetical protein
MRVPECHPDRAHQAKGLCQQCYLKQYYARRNKRKDPSEYAANYRKPPSKPTRVAGCHPDRAHHAKGLCQQCYLKQRTNAERAACHPDRPHLAKGMCASCYAKSKYEQGAEVYRQRARDHGKAGRERLRTELLDAYGGKCACLNCPEANPAFLCLDHVNGDGKVHRMKMGSHVYADLRRRGFPQDGYRLLCWNCNSATRFGRTCPHEEES